MPRFSFRLWLGLAGAIALVVMGYTLLRRGSFLTAAATTARAAKGLTSESSPGEWAMEGHNPARTRALRSGITLPVNRQRALQVADDKGAGSPIAIVQNVMLVEAEHRLRALSVRTGKEIWSFAEVGQYISPAVAGNTVFIRAEAANKGSIFALDLATGRQRWSFTPRRLGSEAVSYWGGHLTSPVVAGGTVFIGAGKELYALDAASGKTRWEHSGADYVSSSATVADGRVFISDAKNVYAIDAQTGALAWKIPTNFAVYFSPIVANQTVFLTNGEKVMALHTANGAKRWEKAIASQTLLPAAVQGSRLFVKSTSTLYALDQVTGRELWRFEQPDFISLPAVAGEQIFAVTGSEGRTGRAVLDAATGKSISDQSLPTLASAAPVIAGQTLYLRTTDGQVIGLFN